MLWGFRTHFAVHVFLLKVQILQILLLSFISPYCYAGTPLASDPEEFCPVVYLYCFEDECLPFQRKQSMKQGPGGVRCLGTLPTCLE